MKKVLTLAAAVMLCASLARADGVGLFTDTDANTCDLANPATGLATIYAVHFFNATGSTADQFMVTNAKTIPNMTWLSTAGYDQNYIVLGDIATGISVAYGGCIFDPAFPILTLSYFVAGPIAPCSSMQVVADPVVSQGTVIKADCNFAEISEWGGTFTINSDPLDCPCRVTIAAEQSTWGKVKSLYR